MQQWSAWIQIRSCHAAIPIKLLLYAPRSRTNFRRNQKSDTINEAVGCGEPSVIYWIYVNFRVFTSTACQWLLRKYCPNITEEYLNRCFVVNAETAQIPTHRWYSNVLIERNRKKVFVYLKKTSRVSMPSNEWMVIDVVCSRNGSYLQLRLSAFSIQRMQIFADYLFSLLSLSLLAAI